ncbi:MAG TPA: metal ABC transporter permease [Candidatus Acidoferrales bacterium]|nr:metal ABC transporter permease [Candidatus Acidoferrales bacterium]
MSGFAQMFDPSYLLFPAVVASVILGLVLPLIGAYLILRRAVFLGLTLPQVAGAGLAFTFWLQQLGVLPHLEAGERSLGIIGSLAFTFVAMGLLGYLERHGSGLAEGRLAAAYALAGALTILFIVFNPAGETEILSLLKGEVIAMSGADIKVMALVFGLVLVGLIYFRRELLLSSFDRDLAFLLRGGVAAWDLLLYFLSGLSIAVGVIMAGPLLVFSFMVLPPLAAKGISRGMARFLLLASLIGALTALLGFYVSVRLDWPLGPTDVTLGCAFVFIAAGLRRMLARTRALVVLASAVVLIWGCSQRPAAPLPAAEALAPEPVWLFRVKNTSGLSLRLPSANPLRSLAEMAGRLSPDARATVMDAMRAALREELQRRGFVVRLPEEKDPRLAAATPDAKAAPTLAREGGFGGAMLFTDIRRWETDSRQFVRAWVELKLVRASDGALLWERTIRRALPTPGAADLGQAYGDAVKALLAEAFQ